MDDCIFLRTQGNSSFTEVQTEKMTLTTGLTSAFLGARPPKHHQVVLHRRNQRAHCMVMDHTAGEMW